MPNHAGLQTFDVGCTTHSRRLFIAVTNHPAPDNPISIDCPTGSFWEIRLNAICATIGCIPCALINPVDHVVDINRRNLEIRHVNYLSCVAHGHIEIHQYFLNIFDSQKHAHHFKTFSIVVIIVHHFTKVHCGIYAQGIVLYIIGKIHCV